MITNCCSYGEHCPCLDCAKTCCVDMGDMTDTEKLCEEAKEHCERCALKHRRGQIV